MSRSILAASLFGSLFLGSLPASAVEAVAPPLKAGEVVKLVDKKPDGKVTGWVRTSGERRVELCIEKISGEDRKPGEGLEVWAHMHKVDDRERPRPEDAAVLRQLGPGDRVEMEWHKDEKNLRVVTLKLVRAFPRTGLMTGKVVKHEARGFQLEIAKAPAGFEDMVGQVAPFWVTFVPNPEKGDKKPSHIPNPEQAKLFESLEDSKYVEVSFKSDGRLRVESLKKLDKAPEGVKPGAEAKPEPKPEEKPKPPKPSGEEDF